MCGAQSGLVLLADMEVQVDGVAFLAAAIGDFAHGQTGRVHHLPFRVPRDFPAHHGQNTNPLACPGSRFPVQLWTIWPRAW